jgi:hypothetical protein
MLVVLVRLGSTQAARAAVVALLHVVPQPAQRVPAQPVATTTVAPMRARVVMVAQPTSMGMRVSSRVVLVEVRATTFLVDHAVRDLAKMVRSSLRG